jgi:hypothetical protein
MKVVHYPKIEGANDITGFVFQKQLYTLKVGGSIDMEETAAEAMKRTYKFLTVIDHKDAKKAEKMLEEMDKAEAPKKKAKEVVVEPKSETVIPSKWNELVKMGMELGVYEHKMPKDALIEAISTKLNEK